MLRSTALAGALLVTTCQTSRPSSVSAAGAPTVATAAEPAGAAAAPATGRWTKPSDAALRKSLTPLAYEVTQRDATEPPFRNDYWDNHRAGLYVDVATGQPLFSSADKFESGTGWPSFTRPIEPGAVKTREDDTLGMSRTEVRSSIGDSHLGHVFDDGPAPTGSRYCMNSAALRFIPLDRLEAAGYGEYRAVIERGAPVPASTGNACAAPPPASARSAVAGSHRAGCATTLDTAIVRADAIASLEKQKGVLEVEPGTWRGQAAARVTYDGKTATLPASAVVHAGDDAAFAPRK